MPKFDKPWDQKLADLIIPYLNNSFITPNQITLFSLILALTGSGLICINDTLYANIGATLFIIARFFDHIDGELARTKNITSQLGYYLDYATGGLSYSTLFFCLGLKYQNGILLGHWAIVLGGLGALSAVLSLYLNLRIDAESDNIDQNQGDSVGYPSLFGFELEDGIYLLAPITWLGWLEPFFISAGIGAIIYGFWTLFSLLSVRQKKH